MAIHDGYDVVIQRERERDPCSRCDNRGLVIRNGVLYCATHDPRWL